MNHWITDHNEITDDVAYIVCPINARADTKELYLGQPIGRLKGWEFRRLRKNCYAALECPEYFRVDKGGV